MMYLYFFQDVINIVVCNNYTNYDIKCHLNKLEYIFLYRSKFYLHSRSYGYNIIDVFNYKTKVSHPF